MSTFLSQVLSFLFCVSCSLWGDQMSNKYTQEAVAKLLCPEKSMILRPFESGSQAATAHPTILRRHTEDPVDLLCCKAGPSGSIEEGLKGPQKGDFNGQMSFATASQVMCTYSKIKEGCLENVKQWLKSLENERRDEILESFLNEGVLLESAFIREKNNNFYLIYFMRAHDIDQAMAVFRNSTLAGDAFHKQCWEQFTEQHEVLTPIFHAESEKMEMMSHQTMQMNPHDALVDVIALSKTLCPHPIQGKLAYATEDNFLGRIVDGYSPHAPAVCLLTNKAARQLCLVQRTLNDQGLGLFIFDAFRPLRAVRDFSSWYHQPIANVHEAQRKRLHFPHLEKTDLPRLGYAPEGVSRHCFGHAVDLSLIDLTTDQLLDMGTIFDYFDRTSHHPETSSEIIGKEAFKNRQLLAESMKAFGFIAYPQEYWHFDYREQELTEPADIAVSPELVGLNVKDAL